MISEAKYRTLFPGQLAVLLLASAVALPALAQQSAQPQNPDLQQPAAAAAPSEGTQVTPLPNTEHEGFWGHVNPFARKKWVNKRLDPIKGQLNELDEVNAKNAKDIQDVDGRAQAGIHRAQSTADQAGQTASAAGAQAQQANATAQQASGRVSQLDSTVNGIDQYHQTTDLDVVFHGQAVLSSAAKKQLDTLAAGLADKQGYIVEIEGHSRAAGSIGIQNSEKMAEAVKRYLVIEHQIPVYRLHSVAMGNAQVAADGEAAGKPVSSSSVHLRLMENSLAAQAASSPHGEAALNGAERP